MIFVFYFHIMNPPVGVQVISNTKKYLSKNSKIISPGTEQKKLQTDFSQKLGSCIISRVLPTPFRYIRIL